MRIEAVVINCSTREQSTLALASVIRRTGLPATLIDCESTDGSAEFFGRLRSRLPFTLAAMPLARHGDTLDRIFRESRCDALLLLDSDAEILREDFVPMMCGALTERDYGAGFLHPGQWLGSEQQAPRQIGYYAPRMWIPCVLLRVAPVRAALDEGRSFRDRYVGNEIARLPRLSQFLGLRFRLPLLRRLELDALRPLRAERCGVKPHYLYYDTGAALHEHLVRERHLGFAGLPSEIWASCVAHHHGVTRKRLKRRMRNATDARATRAEAVERVESVYGIAVPELGPKM